MRRPPINISPAERLARVAVSLGGAIAGAWLLGSASGVRPVVLDLALVAAGLDLVATGTLGHSPLYRRLSHPHRLPGQAR